MCLIINREATEELKNSGQTEIKIYKVLRKKGTGLVSPFKEMVYKPGEIVAIDNYNLSIPIFPKDTSAYDGVVKVGIHVFLTKGEAEFFISFNIYDGIILKCTANINDLIACGTFKHYTTFNSAVFKKITVSEEDYNSALYF